MSTSTPLARTRSLRQPAGPNTDDSSRLPRPDAPRNTSPSRLPVKPPSSAIASTSTTSARTATSTIPSAGTAPRSAPSTTLASRNLRSAAKTDNAPPTRTATASASTITRRPTIPSSQSAAVPKPSTGTTTSAPARTRTAHIRSKSSATALTDATVLRPMSSISSISQASSASTESSVTSRPPVTGQTRSLHRRAASTTVSSRSADLSRPQQAQQQPPQPLPNPRLQKPAFNNMQQQFSPLKSTGPKPLTSTYLAPPSPSKLPANVAISAETSRLQTELLQLHLLHREAAPVARQWHASARSRLAERFATVSDAHVTVARAETKLAEDVNACALRAWAGEDGSLLESRVQTLDAAVCGLWEMSERHTRVVRRFEKWVDRLQTVIQGREEGELDVDGELVFVGELDGAWRDECASLARKLDGWRRDLRDLGDVEDLDGPQVEDDAKTSSLSAMLTGCRSLVNDMLAELNLMEDIEREALKQEAEWTEKTAREDGKDDTPKAGAIWRVL